MTEFEKLMQGLPHVFDGEMMQMFHHACRLTREYNQTGEDEAGRNSVTAFEVCGQNLYIHPGFSL